VHPEAQTNKIPCIFPASREIWASETSSIETASSREESSANFLEPTFDRKEFTADVTADLWIMRFEPTRFRFASSSIGDLVENGGARQREAARKAEMHRSLAAGVAILLSIGLPAAAAETPKQYGRSQAFRGRRAQARRSVAPG
jgi:hypothetical protein